MPIRRSYSTRKVSDKPAKDEVVVMNEYADTGDPSPIRDDSLTGLQLEWKPGSPLYIAAVLN